MAVSTPSAIRRGPLSDATHLRDGAPRIHFEHLGPDRHRGAIVREAAQDAVQRGMDPHHADLGDDLVPPDHVPDARPGADDPLGLRVDVPVPRVAADLPRLAARGWLAHPEGRST